MVVNLSLNRKYAVDEIGTSQRMDSLVGIRSIVRSDYANVEWLLIINSIVLWVVYYIRRINQTGSIP
jgi:hypothetical protein